MTGRITIWRGDNSWMATFHDDEGMIAAFGTDTLPTPYTLRADGLTVLNAVRERNPGCTVSVRCTVDELICE